MKQGKRKMATMAIVATLLATGATAQTYTHHYPKAVERAAAKWVKQGQWRGAFNKAVPAPTVNLTEFCIQYSRNPKLWDELFQWLQNNDLKALKKMIDILEDNDDVQKVHHNCSVDLEEI